MRIYNMFAAGGVVMWPLLGFSVLALALIIERIAFWQRINRRQGRVVREVLTDRWCVRTRYLTTSAVSKG